MALAFEFHDDPFGILMGVFLFDLVKNVGEQNNLAEIKPETVMKLQARMEALDSEITKNARQPWFKN